MPENDVPQLDKYNYSCKKTIRNIFVQPILAWNMNFKMMMVMIMSIMMMVINPLEYYFLV